MAFRCHYLSGDGCDNFPNCCWPFGGWGSASANGAWDIQVLWMWVGASVFAPCRTKFKFCEEVLLLQCEQFCSPPYKTRGHSTAFFFLERLKLLWEFFTRLSACKVLPIILGGKIRLFGCDAAYSITGLHLYMSAWHVKTLSIRNLCNSFWGSRRESPVYFPSCCPVSIQSWRIMT